MPLADAYWWPISMAGEGVVYSLYSTQLIAGEHTANALVFILFVHMVIRCGISSACGLAFLARRSFLFVIDTGLQLLASASAAVIKSGLAPLRQGARRPAFDLATPDARPTAKLDVSDPNKTSGRDSGSGHSELSSVDGVPTPGHGVTLDVNPVKQLVSQVHLLLMCKFDGDAVSPKPRLGRRAIPTPIHSVDLFSRNGTVVLSALGPVAIYICGKHREYYDGGNQNVSVSCRIALIWAFRWSSLGRELWSVLCIC